MHPRGESYEQRKQKHLLALERLDIIPRHNSHEMHTPQAMQHSFKLTPLDVQPKLPPCNVRQRPKPRASLPIRQLSKFNKSVTFAPASKHQVYCRGNTCIGCSHDPVDVQNIGGAESAGCHATNTACNILDFRMQSSSQ